MLSIFETFETQRGGSGNVPAMDGLRGVAVFLVFLVHFETLGSHWIPPALDDVSRMVHKIGVTGVDLFFLISGYLIYKSLVMGKPRSSYQYLSNRVRRIYPVFTLMLLLYVVISIAVVPERSKLPAGFFDATMHIVANWLLLPGVFPIVPIMVVAWSLSYEMAFYLVAPMIVKGFFLRDKDPSTRLRFLSFLTLILLIFFYLVPTHARMLGFVFGMIVCDWTAARSRPVPDFVIWIFGAIGVAGIAMGRGRLLQTIFTMCLYVPFLLAVTARSSSGLLEWVLTSRAVRWLGNISYSYYLTHGLVLNVLMSSVLGGTNPHNVGALISVLVLSFLATLCVGTIMFWAVEQRYMAKMAHATLEPSANASAMNAKTGAV